MKNRKKGFTLIELLIVTVVIVMLMGIVFRLAGSGGESAARAQTIAKIQRLSNAIGGYYAAFGSYPPVPLQHRSRNIYAKVLGSSMGYGIQDPDSEPGSRGLDKKQIEAACRAQPVGLTCPFNADSKSPVRKVLAAMKKQDKDMPDYSLIEDYGSFDRKTADWRKNSVFMFGLMSFLLPRYQIMMDGISEMYDTISCPTGPWGANNRLPYLLDGTRPKSWSIAGTQDGRNVQDWLGMGKGRYDGGKKKDTLKAPLIDNIASQAVCARWMPNLEGIVSGGGSYFGINTYDRDHGYLDGDWNRWCVIGKSSEDNDKDDKNRSGLFLMNHITVRDGWGRELYYYSAPPYQSYMLWSAGPNGRTFPPWMDIAKLPSGDRKSVYSWIKDDLHSGDK